MLLYIIININVNIKIDIINIIHNYDLPISK